MARQKPAQPAAEPSPSAGPARPPEAAQDASQAAPEAVQAPDAPAAPYAAPKQPVAPQEPPVQLPVRLMRDYGFFEDGRLRLWPAGARVTDLAEAAMLCWRGAPVEPLPEEG